MKKALTFCLVALCINSYPIHSAFYDTASKQRELDLIEQQQNNEAWQNFSKSIQRDNELKQQQAYQQEQLKQQAQQLQWQQEQQKVAEQRAYVAEQQRIEAAVKSILNPIYSTRRNLLDQIDFYLKGRAENKKKYIFNQHVGTEISQKILQVPSRFDEGVRTIAATWPSLSETVEVRNYYVRAYQEFSQAVQKEIKGHKAVFWQVRAELDNAAGLSQLAFEDAMHAFEKNREFLLNMGMRADDPQMLIINNDLVELKQKEIEFSAKTEK